MGDKFPHAQGYDNSTMKFIEEVVAFAETGEHTKGEHLLIFIIKYVIHKYVLLIVIHIFIYYAFNN